MSGKQKIWIDMTDLRLWNGFMTGVQRVIYQVALRFDESSDYETGYFAYDKDLKIFVEVSFDEIRNKIESEANFVSEVAVEGIQRWLAKAPRVLITRIPANVRRRIPKKAKSGLKRGARRAVSTVRRGRGIIRRRMRSSATAQLKALEFGPNDTLLIMGKTWDIPELIPELGRLKQTQGFKMVHLVHDMVPSLEPHMFGPGLFEPYTDCLFEVCSLSDHMLAVSKSTKKDILQFCSELRIKAPPVTVVRLGDDISDVLSIDDDYPSPDPRIKDEFILQVGTIEVRKNHLLSYLAYREAELQGIKLPQLIMIGNKGWLTDDLIWQIEHDPVTKDRILILPGIGDRDKLWLFKNCRFTVYPSSYEGWGMPVGESLAYGKACITSKTSSLPEAGQGLAAEVSPYNTQEMLDTLKEYMDDKKLAAIEKVIKDKYEISYWDGTFRQIAAALSD